jgi:TP901 family phage tail tape measure protein
MATGATVNLELLIRATNSASKEVVKLQSQLNELTRGAVEFGKKSAQANQKSAKELTALEKEVRSYTDAAKKAEEATKGFGKAGAALLGIAASLSAAAFFPIKSAADFEQALSGVIAVTGGAEESIEALKATASELGRTTRFTAQEAAVGMQYLGQAGFDAGEVIAGIGPSLQLAVAAAVDLGQAANIATNVLSGMRLPVSELQVVVDVLAKTAAESNAELTDMADALSYAGPIAAAAGVGLQDLASVVGVLGNAGIQGSRAGTALRGTIFALTKPTGEAAAALDRLGVNIQLDTDGSLDLVDAFHQLADAGLNAADAQEIFGRYASSGVLAITSQIDALDDMIVANEAAAGAAEKMAQTMKDNLKGAFVELLSALDGLKRAFGDPLLKPLRAVIELVTGFLGVITSIAEEMPVLTKVIGVLAGVVAILAAGFGALALAVASFNATLGALASTNVVTTLLQMKAAMLGYASATKVALTTTITFEGVLKGLKSIMLLVQRGLKTLWTTMLANPITALLVLVGGLILYFAELSEKQKRLAEEAKLAAVEFDALRSSYSKQISSLKEMEEGSKKAIATGKNMREQLLKTAESNKELSVEARRAANSIDEFTGKVKDGGVALEAFVQRSKELAEVNLKKQVEAANLQLDRHIGKVKDATYWWNETNKSLKATWGLITGGISGWKRVTAEQVAETKKMRDEIELTNRSVVEMIDSWGEFDVGMSQQEVIEYFRIVRGYSKEHAESIAATHAAMQEEGKITRDITRSVQEMSLEGLRTDISETTVELAKMADEYEDLKQKSAEAAEAISAVPENLRDRATAETEAFKKANEERIKAKQDLLAKETEINSALSVLQKQLAEETAKNYKAEIDELERNKELGLLAEWEYNQKIAKIDKDNAEAKLKNAQELQKALVEIQESTTQKLAVSGDIGNRLRKSQDEVTKYTKAAADERLKHQIQVNEYIAESEEDAAGIRIDLMEEGTEKFIAERDAELDALRESAEDMGVEWDKMYGIRNAIVAKYDKEIEDWNKEQEEKRKKEADKRAKEEEKRAEALAKAKIDADKAITEVQKGAADEDDYETRNQLELQALRDKHAEQLEIISKFYDDEALLKQIRDQQEIELEQKKQDQLEAIRAMQWEHGKEAAADAVEATKWMFGEQSKEAKAAFALQKAMAIKDTIMTTYKSAQSVFDSLSKIPYVGYALGAAAAAATVAAGLARVAKIRAQTLAEGGEVKGKSPHPKADNVPIWATAKEFVQPVSAVSYYGRDIMEALRKKMIPRELFSGLPVPKYAYASSPSRRGYATGGQVSGMGGGVSNAPAQQKQEIKIMNYVDQREMLSALGSPEGESAVINVISSNRDKVQRVLR